MVDVLTDGKMKIGACKLPDRKKPCLYIEIGNEVVVYGTFQNGERAKQFMDKLAQFVRAPTPCGGEGG